MNNIEFVTVVLAGVLLAACGRTTTPPAVAPATATAVSQDHTPGTAPAPVAVDVTAGATVTSSVRLPNALTSLEWPAPPLARSVAAQRRRLAAAGPDARHREAANLATALWYSEASGSDGERTARAEARAALRDVAAAGGATETVLWMLTVAERALGDVDASGKVYDELILRFPQSPRAWRYRAVRAWIELRALQHRRAAEIIDGADLGAQATPAVVHYVAGWIALRRGNPTEGHALLVTAIQRWADLWSWDQVRLEAFDLAALAAAKPDYMLQIAGEIMNGPPRREAGTTNKRIRTVVRGGKRTTVTEETTIKYQKEWLGLELGRAYATYGRASEARNVLERSLGGDPAIDAAIERELMLLAIGSSQPGVAAAHAAAARTALDKAITDSGAGDVRELGDALTQEVERYAAEVTAFAQITGLDEFRTAGESLSTTGGPPGVTADAATPDAYRMVVLDAQIRWSMAPLRACYATRLQSQASFAGRVSFKLDPGASGRAVLSELSPSDGDEGLAAVAGCVARIAADWRMTPAPGALSTTATIELDFQAR